MMQFSRFQAVTDWQTDHRDWEESVANWQGQVSNVGQSGSIRSQMRSGCDGLLHH